MMFLLRYITLFLSFLFLFSCARNFPVASENVHQKALQLPPLGMGKVYCFGTGFNSALGIDANCHIILNSKIWGEVKGKNYLFANLKPGKYQISGPSGIRVDPYVLDVKPNKLYFLDSKSNRFLMKWSFFELDETKGRKYITENLPSGINSLSDI